MLCLQAWGYADIKRWSDAANLFKPAEPSNACSAAAAPVSITCPYHWLTKHVHLYWLRCFAAIREQRLELRVRIHRSAVGQQLRSAADATRLRLCPYANYALCQLSFSAVCVQVRKQLCQFAGGPASCLACWFVH